MIQYANIQKLVSSHFSPLHEINI